VVWGVGFVPGWAALVMGILAGSVPWWTMMWLHKRWWLLQNVDDTLGVFHTHAVAGLLGGICVGLFAEPKLCEYMGLAVTNSNGLFYGGEGGMQVLKQVVGASFVVGWNVVVTTLIVFAIGMVMPLRMSEEHLLVGDDAEHGEEAYALWGDGEKFDVSRHAPSDSSSYDYDQSLHGPRLGRNAVLHI
jgi:Amt family ammonium transporter